MTDEDDSLNEETVRKAVDHAQSGAPAAGSAVRDRFSADEIFQRVVAAAGEEVNLGLRELFFSGLAAGFAIALTFMLHASFAADFGEGAVVASGILYPLGFIYIIIGNYQLYTENTLPPVALVLERFASVPRLLRIWSIVFAANVLGAGIGAYVLANTGVLTPEAVEMAHTFGTDGDTELLTHANQNTIDKTHSIQRACFECRSSDPHIQHIDQLKRILRS